MASRTMSSFFDVVDITENSFVVEMYIRHDAYKSYSRAVKPFSSRKIKDTWIDIHIKAANGGFRPKGDVSLTLLSLDPVGDSDELSLFECNPEETVTVLKYLAEN